MFFPKFTSKNCTQERVILVYLGIYIVFHQQKYYTVVPINSTRNILM